MNGDLLNAVFRPYTDLMGDWFYAIFFGCFLMLIWIKSESAILPTVTFIPIAPVAFFFLPPGASVIYTGFLALAIASTFYRALTRKGMG
jgi:hypothetical protein